MYCHTNSMRSNSKPFSLKAIVFLLFLFGIINLVSNIIKVFFIKGADNSFFGMYLKFDPITELILNVIAIILLAIFVCGPAILSFFLGIIVWKEKKISYWIILVMLPISLVLSLNAISYLRIDLSELFTKDVVVLMKNTDKTTWTIFNNNLFPIGGDVSLASTNNLVIRNILLIKSFAKWFTEIIAFGFLLFTIVRYDSHFRRR